MWRLWDGRGNLAAMLRTRLFPFGTLVVVMLVALGGCAYPRRSTALSPVGDASSGAGTTPDDLFKITFVSAIIPPRERSGREWDPDGDGGPDAFVRVYRGDDLLWTSSVVADTLEPHFDESPPRNMAFPRSESLRFELWDSDDVTPQIIGVWQNRGLPSNALPDADANVTLDGGAQIVFRISRPAAHRGVGISAYEARGQALKVLSVEEFSPAGRAGVQPGDSIVAIGGHKVDDLGEARAASALSLAADRQESLTLERSGTQLEAPLDNGFVWLSM